VTADSVPDAINVPSDTSGGCTPKPKYDSPVSLITAPPTAIVASMIRNDATFGMMCPTMIRTAPSTRHETVVRTHARSMALIATSGGIIVGHIIPNVASFLIIDATIAVGGAVMSETGLSYSASVCSRRMCRSVR